MAPELLRRYHGFQTFANAFFFVRRPARDRTSVALHLAQAAAQIVWSLTCFTFIPRSVKKGLFLSRRQRLLESGSSRRQPTSAPAAYQPQRADFRLNGLLHFLEAAKHMAARGVLDQIAHAPHRVEFRTAGRQRQQSHITKVASIKASRVKTASSKKATTRAPAGQNASPFAPPAPQAAGWRK